MMPAQSTANQRPQRPPSAHVPFFVPLFNPIAQRLLRVGVPLGPNALLTVRGRKSGEPRSTPVAIVDIGGHRWIIGTFGEVNWVRNLRAAGEATVTISGRAQPVQAIELSTSQTAEFFRETLGAYVRKLPLGRWLLGTVLGAREILSDPDTAAIHHPVFELRARPSDGSGAGPGPAGGPAAG
jgi:deazaflavin-dependent oxidoreductase (nitroreductase family)